MIKLPDTSSDKLIKECIEKQQSFRVVAGAGSGKTTSLIKALDHVKVNFGKQLLKSGQKVTCITFTNRAVDVINEKLKYNDLFVVSTLHSFLWDLIKNFHSDIKETLINQLIPEKITKKSQDDNGKESKKAIAAREAIERYNQDIAVLGAVDLEFKFKYEDGNRSDYSKGILAHDDIIKLAALMILKYPYLQTIIHQQFPFIFIDEAQDTYSDIVDALNKVCEKDGKLPIIGYFGDPMQQIYDDDRAGDFIGPEGSETIPKEENFRCSTEVISFLNRFRGDIKQVSGANNKKGSVQIRLVQAEKGEAPRNTYSDDQLDRVNIKFNEAIDFFGWRDVEDIKRLFLARLMIARKLGFVNLHKLFTGKYASSKTQEAYEKGNYFLLKPFINVLVPLIEAINDKDDFEILNVLRSFSPILKPKGKNENSSLKDVIAGSEKALDLLTGKWGKATLGEILKDSINLDLVSNTDMLDHCLNREPRAEEYDEELFVKEKGDWLADEFLKMDTSELMSYVSFINDKTPFSTQHGVKGEEYKKVLVLFDDTEANWNNYSFSKLLTPVASGKEPTDGQREKSYKLAYVCFSRAEEDLRIILFTLDPAQAKKELLDYGWFEEEQISIDA